LYQGGRCGAGATRYVRKGYEGAGEVLVCTREEGVGHWGRGNKCVQKGCEGAGEVKVCTREEGVGQGQQSVSRKDMRGQEQIKESSKVANDGENDQAKRIWEEKTKRKRERRQRNKDRKTHKGKAEKN
jgi:hypothetical protein